MLHLTLTGMTVEAIKSVLSTAKQRGVKNILALRGDPARGQTEWKPVPGGMSKAEDLVRLIRKEHGDYFCIAVAGFPEGHDGAGREASKPPAAARPSTDAASPDSSGAERAADKALRAVSAPREEDKPAEGDSKEAGTASGEKPAPAVAPAKAPLSPSKDPAAAGDPWAGSDGSYAVDLRALKGKVDAGADMVLTQLFYDPAVYSAFVRDARAAGVPDSVPIIPGLLPLYSRAAFERVTRHCNIVVPRPLRDVVEACGSDEAKLRRAGRAYMAAMGEELLAAGAPGLHFYTLNLESEVRAILSSLGLAKGLEARKLPWRPSADGSRAGQEQVRPIFWANRPRSYVARTEDWDVFPRGRWGGADNPAFAELQQSHFAGLVLGSAEERRAMWGEAPASDSAVREVFVGYLTGRIERLPWCDQPLHAETSPLVEAMARLNRAGYLTINSQPRVNGARSDDPTYGWGGKGGYVYQKAYIECFCRPKALRALMEAALEHPSITYLASDKKGNTYSNRESTAAALSRSAGGASSGAGADGAGLTAPRTKAYAVTWGVFPGREVKQPTVVDPAAFLAWRDEAFVLWGEAWAGIYEADSDAREHLEAMRDECFLLCVVDDDFVGGDVFAVFDNAARRLGYPGGLEDCVGPEAAVGGTSADGPTAGTAGEQKAAAGAAAAAAT